MEGVAIIKPLTEINFMSDYLFPFEKLDVWKIAVDLAEYILDLLEKLPQNKHIRLIGQIESAGTSSAQNIAGSAP